jgi:hypothetical protein
MNSLRPLLILLAGLLLAAALVGLVVRENQARNGGREVALTMQGVDPRDLLSGHYLAFDLVEPLSEAEMCPVTLLDPVARTGWVALSPKRDHWQATGMADDRAKAARLGVLTVRGEASCYPHGNHEIRLEIGVHRLHATQADAERLAAVLNRWNDGKRVEGYALVSVGQDGRARLTGVRIGGERFRLDW